LRDRIRKYNKGIVDTYKTYRTSWFQQMKATIMKHLSLSDRIAIESGINQGKSCKEIAKGTATVFFTMS